jgi:hypothetical protein
MTRFAWLQSRTQTLGGAGLLAVVAVVAAITGVQLAHLYSSITSSCGAVGDCQPVLMRFVNHDSVLQSALNDLLKVVPALLGIFWGAPLVAREFETGTFRLAWTQSVSRSRWLTTKLALGVATSAVLAGLLTLTITWWYRSIDHVSITQFAGTQYQNFDVRDIVPIGYAIFAFTVGALAGAMIRRTVPAMFATLVAFVGVRVAVDLWIRPHLFAPVHVTSSLLHVNGNGFLSQNGGPVTLVPGSPTLPNAWIISSQLVTKSGHSTTPAQLAAFFHRYCPSIASPPPLRPSASLAKAPAAAFQNCLVHAAQRFNVLTSYQPGRRYWAFQWTETGIFVALALLAAFGCYRWVTHRVN